ncbi:MAG: SIS domain-containing protein [Candidatus Thorarchaeota archaeon]|jgi:glucosamine 6-phosphate synthetase-like amidotransferase/phosphosugar isomerase protein
MTKFLNICYNAIKLQEKSIPQAIAEAEKASEFVLDGRKQIVLVGCGDSYAAADYGRWAFLNVGLNALFVSPDELSHLRLDKDSVVIGITASGRSLTVIDALQRSRKRGASTIVLTDNEEGTASQDADHVWITKSGVETYNTSPSAPTTSAMAYLLAISSKLGESDGLEHDIQQLKSIGKKMITWTENVGKTISELARPNVPIYLISEGPNHVAAQIGMMKFNEFSILKGIAVLREEFRHHYNLSINDDDIAILISNSPPEPSDAAYMGALTDTLRLKAYHLFTDEGLNLELPLVQAILNMIALQMASYYTVLKFDPNKEWFKKPNVDAFTIY